MFYFIKGIEKKIKISPDCFGPQIEKIIHIKFFSNPYL